MRNGSRTSEDRPLMHGAVGLETDLKKSESQAAYDKRLVPGMAAAGDEALACEAGSQRT